MVVMLINDFANCQNPMFSVRISLSFEKILCYNILGSINFETIMTENFLELKTINDLAKYSFFIPAYQRGYRWTERQVIDLLEDIKDFTPKDINNGEDKTWYCLQPIVVKRKSDENYEVIDGQQRLTTIYLIWHYLNQFKAKDWQDKLFDISYETRSNTTQFLSNPAKRDASNIDYFHISNAYKEIDNWFKNLKDKDSNFDVDNFRSKFKFNTKVIWYETFEDNTISIFTRLNIGKISLTNAELIKALFLNSSNYSKELKEEADRIIEKQLKIATEWDQIEYKLQDDKLWYFLTNENRESNRIELIFDLIAGIDNKTKKDAYETFRFFSIEMQSKDKDTIEGMWKKIKSYYQCFNEWYNERELYHKIGFILYSGIVKLKDLYDYSKAMKKSAFRLKIDELIKNYFKKISLKNLQYDDNETKQILLLYNILTMLQNDKDDAYFPFDLFKDKKNPWDVEHIASVRESMPEKEEDIKNWLNDVFPYIDETIVGGNNLKNKIKKFENYSNKEGFEQLFNEVIDHFNHYIKDEEDINGLSNLSLLLASINRGYKNSVFPIKRKTIIERDKSGTFIPICTKNVFLKYFSDYPPKISFWTKDDRNKYEEDLKRILSPYVQWEEQNA